MVWCTITVFQRKREVARKFNLTPPRDYHVKLGYDALFVNSTLTTTYGWHRSGRLGYRASPSHWWWRWPVVNRTVIRAHLAMQDRYTDKDILNMLLGGELHPTYGKWGKTDCGCLANRLLFTIWHAFSRQGGLCTWEDGSNVAPHVLGGLRRVSSQKGFFVSSQEGRRTAPLSPWGEKGSWQSTYLQTCILAFNYKWTLHGCT